MTDKYSVPKGSIVNLNLAPDSWYRPKPGNSVDLNLDGVYVAPAGDSVTLSLGPAITPPDGYVPSFDLSLITPAEPYLPTFDLHSGEYVEPELPVPTVIPVPFKTSWGRATPIDKSVSGKYEASRKVDVQINTPYSVATPVDNPFLLKQVRLLTSIDKPYNIKRKESFNRVNKPYAFRMGTTLEARDINYKITRKAEFDIYSTPYSAPYLIPPAKDNQIKLVHNAVRLYGVERVPIYATEIVGYTPSLNVDLKQAPYIPSLDLPLVNLTGSKADYEPYEPPEHNAVNLSFDTAYTSPPANMVNLLMPPQKGGGEANGGIIGYELTPIQPTGCVFTTKAGKPSDNINYSKPISWGYGLNNFVIGGQWRDIYGTDTEPPEPPEPIEHPDYGVYIAVNIVNIVRLPDNVPVEFENLSITYDIDSFVWTASFTVPNRQNLNLIKPVGRDVKEVMITINGESFKFFVGTIRTSRSVDGQGNPVENYNCTAWSPLKKLAHPYSAKKSYTDETGTTAAQAVTLEAQAKGFAVDWQTVDWNIPAGVHGYQDKTPIGAILSVVQSVGGVVIPNADTDGFTVRPRFPVSPWQWNDPGTAVDRTMNETRFFSIDNSTVPKDNPDGVFVYSESEGGEAVKAVRIGRPGTAMLPDVVDKYITAVTAGQERGRIEVARNSFIELIPMSTYVDELGLVKPLDLIEFTTPEGDTWRGQVVSFSVTCERIGTALVQNITVARFFDDE